MKRRANRQEVKTLCILGAGASLALSHVAPRKKVFSKHTTPLDGDFLKKLIALNPNGGWRKSSLKLIQSNWLEKGTEISDYGLEEAIIKRVSDYDLLSTLHPDNSRRKCSNAEFINNLSHLITAYLSSCRSNSSGRTRKFINHYFPPRIPVNSYRNRIITFNYDTIIDRALIERGISKRKIYFDRCVQMQANGTRRNNAEVFNHPLLLKLHGSLNWKCTTAYFRQIIDGTVKPKDKIPIWSDDTGPPKPDDAISPLIIPPVPAKPITSASIFCMLWTKAFEYLHEAQRIVIVGYSCPKTDVLAQSLFQRFRNMGVKEFVIVDPDSSSLPKYHSMTKGNVPKSAEWKYFHNFNEFIDNGL